MSTDFEQNLSHQVLEKVNNSNKGAAGSKWLPYVIAVIGILGMVGIVGFIYGKAQNPTEDDKSGEIPLITASKDDIKVRPDVPGGMDIPHQDRLVFDSLNNEKTSETNDLRQIEAQLAPQPESPIQTPDVTSLLTDKNAPTEPVTILMAESSKSKKDKEAERASLIANLGLDDATTTPTQTQQKQAGNNYPMPTLPSISKEEKPAPVVKATPTKKVAVAPKPAPKAKAKPKAKPVVKAKAKPKAKPVPKKVVKKAVAPKKVASTVKAVSSGKYRVQLGAFSKESSATSEVARLKNSLSPLKGLQTFVVPKTSGAGTVYKIQAGNLGTHADATKICSQLKAKGQGCFVAKR